MAAAVFHLISRNNYFVGLPFAVEFNYAKAKSGLASA